MKQSDSVKGDYFSYIKWNKRGEWQVKRLNESFCDVDWKVEQLLKQTRLNFSFRVVPTLSNSWVGAFLSVKTKLLVECSVITEYPHTMSSSYSLNTNFVSCSNQASSVLLACAIWQYGGVTMQTQWLRPPTASMQSKVSANYSSLIMIPGDYLTLWHFWIQKENAISDVVSKSVHKCLAGSTWGLVRGPPAQASCTNKPL